MLDLNRQDPRLKGRDLVWVCHLCYFTHYVQGKGRQMDSCQFAETVKKIFTALWTSIWIVAREVTRNKSRKKSRKRWDGKQDGVCGSLLQLLQIARLDLKFVFSFGGSVICNIIMWKEGTAPSIISADLLVHLPSYASCPTSKREISSITCLDA